MLRRMFAARSQRPAALVALGLTIIFAGVVQADDDVRCDGKLIGAGRSRIEVLRYCGAPQDQISYLDERTTHSRFALVQQGTTQFTRRVGTYVEKTRDAVTTTTTDAQRTDKIQETKPVVLSQNHQHDESRLVREETSQSTTSYVTVSSFWECKKRSVHVDEFTYNFGSGKFMTFFLLENGRVKAIKYGEYGFD